MTSENKYVDYFSIDELATEINNSTRQIKFYTIAQDTIKFKMSQKNLTMDNYSTPRYYNSRTTTTTTSTEGYEGYYNNNMRKYADNLPMDCYEFCTLWKTYHIIIFKFK